MKNNFFDTRRVVSYIDCVCGDANHVLRFELIDWEDDLLTPEDNVGLDISFLFPRYRFFRRIFQALRYVLFFRRHFEGFYGTAIAVKDSDRIIEILQAYKLRVERYRVEELRSEEGVTIK